MTSMETARSLFPIVLFLQLAGWHGNAIAAGNATNQSWQYCIVGAGPSGLQMGYFLDRAGRDYVILDKANASGSFFTVYPRHRKLISINKRHTGKTNKEFNFRHDWNSLISDDESLFMKHYSKDFFPHADTYVQYLNDYSRKLHLNVKYNTAVQNISRSAASEQFTFLDQHGRSYSCRIMIISTGISVPNEPNFKGFEHTESYSTVSLDPNDFEGKSVLIIGRGNSAFETADNILGSTNVIHMVARSRLRMAWESHYVGDLRAVNNGLIDTYQLKSLDGILQGDIADMAILRRADGRLIIVDGYELPETLPENATDADIITHMAQMMPDNFALREPYHKAIRCMGFVFDNGIFNNDTKPQMGKRRLGKYPLMLDNYESADVPDLFFTGAISHAIDYRKSAGGFIHGYRYTARALFRILEVRYQSVPWPTVRLPMTGLINHIIKRINEASGTYQMFGILADVIVLHSDTMEYEYIMEFPVKLISELSSVTGRNASQIIVVLMEYGKDSGPGTDIFVPNRAITDPELGHLSNFLHPVLYYYSALPTAEAMSSLGPKDFLPTPEQLHHVVEDFLTDWTAPVSHILLMRRFLESCLGSDLRYFFDSNCFRMAMTNTGLPVYCQQHYMKGQGLEGNAVYWGHVSEMQSILENSGYYEHSERSSFFGTHG